MTFEYLDHTADVAVRLQAADLTGLLQSAAEALRDILAETLPGTRSEPSLRVGVRLEAEDREALLVDFLNELVYLFDTRGLVPGGLHEARLETGGPWRLEGLVEGERFDPRRHALRTEVKAATFHGIRILDTADGLEADVVFDL